MGTTQQKPKHKPSPDHVKVVKSWQFPNKWVVVIPHPSRNQFHYTHTETWEGAIYLATHN